MSADIYNRHDLNADSAHRELLRISTHAHGVAAGICIRNYFRLSPV